MRIHLLGLPNAPIHPDYSLDGFAQATHRFARMMEALGHTVFLYGAEGSNAPCTEFIQTISERERTALLERAPANNCQYQHVTMDSVRPLWQRSNATAAAEVARRKQKGDFLLTIGGTSQKLVFDFNPDLLGVEYSVGYSGSFLPHRVFESWAWMHCTYGFQGNNTGQFFDTVIPVFFDPAEFSFTRQPDDYFLYVGRMTELKGVAIACQAAKAAGVKLKLIGHGEGDFKSLITYGEYLGALDGKARNEAMSRAKAVFAPTRYIEPFGCTVVEAQMCGTPVITTDFGAFTETVEQGVSGFRCSYLGEFVRAIKNVESLDRESILARAQAKYSMWNLVHDYDRYFKRLNLRWSQGWNSLD